MRKWTPEERKKQAEAIKNWKPWKDSTGPRTQTGKNTVRKNALKHGMRSARGKEFFRLLARQKLFVRSILNRHCEEQRRSE